MADIIGLSGPQGGGKSTLLNGVEARLKADGAKAIVDDFKVSRAVQARLGWSTLEKVLEDVETMKMFQQTICDVKFEREQENKLRTDADFILTERTFADIASYTQLWAWELAYANKWSVREAIMFNIDFVETCASRQKVYAANLMLPSMPHIKWENDPHRAKQQHVEFITEQLDNFFASKNPVSVPVFWITEESVEGRVQQVMDFLETQV